MTRSMQSFSPRTPNDAKRCRVLEAMPSDASCRPLSSQSWVGDASQLSVGCGHDAVLVLCRLDATQMLGFADGAIQLVALFAA
jgi:hypothetical protein